VIQTRAVVRTGGNFFKGRSPAQSLELPPKRESDSLLLAAPMF
jgi:hypothetical protein